MTESGTNQTEPRSFQAEIDSISREPDYFDVRRYVPAGIDVDLVEKGGALFVPHRINEFAVKVLKKKVTLLVFQCVIRYSLGFNRPTCRLSNGFIGKWTGLLTPNVRKGLRELKTLGLVRIVNPGSPSEATTYDVPIVRGFLEWREQRERRMKQAEIKLISAHPDRISGQSHSRDPEESIPRFNAIYKKETRKKLKTTLPIGDLPPNLRTYILDVRPHQKRVEEEYCLGQLLIDYGPDDIADALAFVVKHGALETAEIVHSPMKYLSYTAEQVLAALRRQRERLERAEQIRADIERKQEEEERKRRQEEEEFRLALESFESSLSEDEQNAVMNEFYQGTCSGNSFVPKNIVRRMAISDWHKKRTKRGP